MRTTTELRLGTEPDAVPRARRFTATSLAGLPTSVVEDAELVVTELVTNALLHGTPPVVLRLQPHGSGVRLEVEDCGQLVPVIPVQSTEAMTGRGLALVSALARSWGIAPDGSGGKVIWVELAEPSADETPDSDPDIDVEALLASWKDEAPAEPLLTVRLGAVPTDLLLAAKSHIDNVVREFTLAQVDGTTTGVTPPPQMAALIETVTRGFASARADIKRQAVEAAERGEPELVLELRQPASAAAAGERYLAALDEADRYARAARLLTLETPAVHRIFRRWYVQGLVDQLRAQAAGRAADPPPTLLQVLTEEVRGLSTLREGWDRLQLLQKVTAELTGAHTVEDIATTVVTNATESLGALSATVFTLDDDGVLRSVAVRTGDDDAAARYQEVPLDADLPGPEVVRTGTPMLLRNQAQLAERFPALAGIFPSERSLHVAPLAIGDHRLGVLTLTFPVGGEIDEQTQVDFVRALADALAQALERALAMQRAAEANERLSFLADASVALSASLDFEETVDAVAALLVPRLADWCSVQVLDHGQLSPMALRHVDPQQVAWAQELRDRWPARADHETPAGQVVRTGQPQLYREIPQELLEQAAVDDEHLQVLHQLGMSSALIVPLSGRTGTFGAVTLVYAESGRQYDESDMPFVEDVARRAALAIETARTFREQSGRLADVTQVAEAAQHAILAPPPEQLGPVALSARYVSASAEALVGGDLYEVVGRPGAVRLLIGDVRGKGLEAVRTATVVLGEFRAAAADLDELVDVAGQIDRRLRPYLGDEDFVTAVIAEVRDDGGFTLVSCGHPAVLLAAGGSVTEVATTATLPLGLGAAPTPATGRLEPGDRILLYTDGIIEARDDHDDFVDLLSLASPLVSAPLDQVLDRVLTALHASAGPELGDDLALLVAEYRPGP